eukprot:c14774_g3_i1 orf=102-392(+)
MAILGLYILVPMARTAFTIGLSLIKGTIGYLHLITSYDLDEVAPNFAEGFSIQRIVYCTGNLLSLETVAKRVIVDSGGETGSNGFISECFSAGVNI